MVRAYDVIGKAIPRVDGPQKVSGTAIYAADVPVDNVLWGKALLSPYAHARIVSIDTSAAKALPGVRAVITGLDFLGKAHNAGRTLRDISLLAGDRVRYVGERVAAVAADDEDIAQRAIDLIDVVYQELPAVFDPEEAAKPGAPILHPDYNTYPGVREQLTEPSNVFVKRGFERGDTAKAFAESDVVVENTYVTQQQHVGYMEPQAAVVWDDKASGRVKVWTCTKAPYRNKEPTAYAMDITEEQILINPVYVGGDFGGKSFPINVPIAYRLSNMTGRPVRMVSDYLEELMAGNPNQMMVFKLKTGLKRDGTMLAHSVEHFANSGAYAGYKPGGAMGGANQAAGPYKIENVKVESSNVYTNTLPGQIFRAPGEPQAIYAIESHIDECAKAIGMDPIEFRMRNLADSGEEMAMGETLEDVRVKDVLQAAVEASGFRTPKAPHIGRGVSVGDRAQGGGQATAEFTLRPDGSVVIGTPLFDQGTGHYTTLYAALAEELDVFFDHIEVDVWNTDSVKFDAGLAGSIGSRLQSTVGYEAAQEVKKAIIAFVARRTGWTEESIGLRGPEARRTDIEESVNWRDLLRDSGETISGRAAINDTAREHITSFAAQVAEVSVDPETGEIKLLKLTTAHDIGQIINPREHQGQINGGVMNGIGFALMEELRFEDGRVTTGSLGDYKIPTMRDIPQLKTVLLEPTRGNGPYGVKGIGEIPTIPTAAAIANAIEDACGARIRDLPMTAEKVYRQLKK
ncbi:MAG TPA: xanthine dehydrogenase family protein molybdopterin-binding subunit [Dehalococcoidia bacterium]|nr:xanthine dehydrogenase family protein molybdopterin-binding subunit [Dehalococcoidia bacterium]